MAPRNDSIDGGNGTGSSSSIENEPRDSGKGKEKEKVTFTHHTHSRKVVDDSIFEFHNSHKTRQVMSYRPKGDIEQNGSASKAAEISHAPTSKTINGVSGPCPQTQIDEVEVPKLNNAQKKTLENRIDALLKETGTPITDLTFQFHFEAANTFLGHIGHIRKNECNEAGAINPPSRNVSEIINESRPPASVRVQQQAEALQYLIGVVPQLKDNKYAEKDFQIKAFDIAMGMYKMLKRDLDTAKHTGLALAAATALLQPAPATADGKPSLLANTQAHKHNPLKQSMLGLPKMFKQDKTSSHGLDLLNAIVANTSTSLKEGKLFDKCMEILRLGNGKSERIRTLVSLIGAKAEEGQIRDMNRVLETSGKAHLALALTSPIDKVKISLPAG